MEAASDNEVVFRKALPSEAEEIAPIIFLSAEYLFNFLFTTKKHMAVEFIKYCCATSRGSFSHKFQTVGLQNNKIVFVMGSYDCNEEMRLFLELAINVLCFYGFFEAFGVLKRGSKFSSIFPPAKKDGVYLSNSASIQEFRSKGNFTKAIKMLKVDAKKRGKKSLELDVETVNSRAQSLYERLGFVIQKTLCFDIGDLHTSVHRMLCKLDNDATLKS